MDKPGVRYLMEFDGRMGGVGLESIDEKARLGRRENNGKETWNMP
jgi:hypothetical protein